MAYLQFLQQQEENMTAYASSHDVAFKEAIRRSTDASHKVNIADCDIDEAIRRSTDATYNIGVADDDLEEAIRRSKEMHEQSKVLYEKTYIFAEPIINSDVVLEDFLAQSKELYDQEHKPKPAVSPYGEPKSQPSRFVPSGRKDDEELDGSWLPLIKGKNPRDIQRFLESRSDREFLINGYDGRGKTLLENVIKGCDTYTIMWFITKYMDMNKRYQHNQNVIHLIVSSAQSDNDNDVVEILNVVNTKEAGLVQKIINDEDDSGKTPMAYAMEKNHRRTANVLRSFSANDL